MSDTLGPLEIEFLINNPQILAQLRQAGANVANFNNTAQRQFDQTSNSVDGFAKKAAIAAASYFSIQAAKNFVTQLVNVRGEFEQLHIAYDTILKSKTKGDALFAETMELAKTTPFSLTEVATSTRQLLAYGFSAKEVTGTLSMLGDVAAGVKIPIGDVAYLYGTLRTQGVAYTKDIREFTNRGIPLIAELAKIYGVTEGKVSKLVEAGKVGFPQVEQAFKNLTGPAGIFYNLMEKQSKSITGQVSNLGDKLNVMLDKFAASQQNVLSGGISAAADFVENYQQVIDVIELTIGSYAAYKAAVFATVAIQRVQQEVTLQQALAGTELTAVEGLQAVSARTLSAARLSLTTALTSNALATSAYAAALAALGLIIYSFATSQSRAEASQSALNDIMVEGAKSTLAQKDKLESLEKTTTSLNNTEAVRLKAAKNLREIMGDRLKQYTDEEIKAGKAKAAIDKYTESLEHNARVAAAGSRIQDLEGRLIDLDTKGITSIPISERIADGLGGIFDGTTTASTGAEIQHFKDKIKGQISDIKKLYQDEIDKANADDTTAPNKKTLHDADFYQKIIDDNTANLKGLDKSAKDFQKQADKYKKLITDAKKELAAFDIKEDQRQADASETAAQRRLEVMRKIYDLNEKYQAQTLDGDSQKLAAIRAEYGKLSADIDKYNANPKNPKKINKGTLQANQNAAIDTQALLNENDYISKDIDKKKALYKEYEEYRDRLGKDAADKQYSDLLQSGATFKDYLNNLSSNISTGPLSGALQARKEIVDKYATDEQKDEAAKNADLLASTLTYNQQRNIVVEKYLKQAADLREKGKDDQAAQAIEAGKQELTQLDSSNIEKLGVYKELYDGLHKISTERAQQDVKQLEAYADAQFKAGLITEEAYLRLKKQLHETAVSLADIQPEKLLTVGSALQTVAGSLQNVNGGLADMVGGLAQAVSNVGNIGKLKNAFDNAQTSQEKFSSGANLVAAGISSVTNLVGVFTSASKKRKEAEEAYQRDVLNFQNQYKLNTIEQIRLNEQLNQNLFFKNYQKDIASAASALAEGDKAFKKSLVDLQGGVAKDGKRNATDADSILKAGAAGATIGGIAGTVVPVIGNAVGVVGGAIIGGVAGAIGGLFGGKKKVDNLVPLLGKYPDLITKAKDGTDQFNDALAKNLIQNNLVTDSTKVLLQNTIDLNDARKAAIDQINQDIKDLAGGLGTDLQNALVTAFENGTDAFTAFKGTVEKGIQDIVAQFLFENIFGGEFDKLSDDLKASFGVTGDQNAVDDLTNFYKNAGPMVKEYQDALKAAQAEAKKNGLDLFQPDAGSPASSSSLAGAIKGITADQASVLEGTTRGIQLGVVEGNDYAKKSQAEQMAEIRNQTLLQMQIAANTKRTADNTDAMVESLENIDSNTSANNLTNALRAAGLN